MMNDAVKLELIEWLAQLKDEATLKILKSVKDSTVAKTDWWVDLSEAEKEGIYRGLRDSEKGNLVVHEEVKKRYGL